MEETFDPYYKWLAIPPAEQPPNCYRLLGVALFESNADVIASAADRQMGHLRTYQNGPYSALSQKLLNEVAQARITLLQPQSKAQYDEHLRQQFSAGPSAPPAPRPPRTAQTLPTARPLVMPAPAHPAPAQPQGHPRPAPAPHPAAPITAAAPAPRAAPRPAPQPHAGPSAMPKPGAQAVKAGDAPISRPKRPQVNGIKQVVGIVLGGLAGCYIAVVILNVIGTPIPNSMRFLPGLGQRAAKAEAAIPDQKPDKNPDASQAPPTPTQKIATARDSHALPATINPFEGPNPSQVDLELKAGNWELRYRETETAALLDASNDSQLVKSLPLAQCFIRQNTVRHGYSEPWQSHYFDSSGAVPAFIVLPLKAMPGHVIDGKVEIDLRGWVSKVPHVHLLEVVVYPDYDLFRMIPLASGTKIKLSQPSEGEDSLPRSLHLDCTATQWKQMYVVIALTSSHKGSGRWVLGSNNGSTHTNRIRFSVVPETAIAATPIAPNGGNLGVASAPSSIQAAELDLRPRFPKNRNTLLPPADFENLIASWRSRLSLANPHEWIEKADSEQGLNDRQALFMIGLREAQTRGDLQLVGFALQKLEAETVDDLTPLKQQTLESMYAARQPLFSPVLFAALSVDVLDKLRRSPSSGDSSKLLKMALVAAQEAGDRDLQRKLALLAAQSNP